MGISLHLSLTIFTTFQLLTSDEPVTPRYSLHFSNLHFIPCSAGIQSVVLNNEQSKAYGISLEQMTIQEFDQGGKTITRDFRFKPTRGMGWNYTSNTQIPSWQEKPVNAVFKSNDQTMWVSLHNAGGVVELAPDTLIQSRAQSKKRLYIHNYATTITDTVDVPLIRTGRTPKALNLINDGKQLLVSNWHSKSLSVLNTAAAPHARNIRTIPVYGTPRCIAVDERNNKSFVSFAGSSRISVINNKTWKIEKRILLEDTPRSMTIDTSGRLFVSFTASGEVACIDPQTGKSLYKAYTHAEPRAIALSKDQRFLFVACSSGNMLDVFEISDTGLKRKFSLECTGNPSGIALAETEAKVEVWIPTSQEDTLKVFTFTKKPGASSLQKDAVHTQHDSLSLH